MCDMSSTNNLKATLFDGNKETVVCNTIISDNGDYVSTLRQSLTQLQRDINQTLTDIVNTEQTDQPANADPAEEAEDDDSD